MRWRRADTIFFVALGAFVLGATFQFALRTLIIAVDYLCQ